MHLHHVKATPNHHYSPSSPSSTSIITALSENWGFCDYASTARSNVEYFEGSACLSFAGPESRVACAVRPLYNDFVYNFLQIHVDEELAYRSFPNDFNKRSSEPLNSISALFLRTPATLIWKMGVQAQELGISRSGNSQLDSTFEAQSSSFIENDGYLRRDMDKSFGPFVIRRSGPRLPRGETEEYTMNSSEGQFYSIFIRGTYQSNAAKA
ncbi:hypothetical protein LguiA_033570 [Lonicera macranthoides]